mmetsp:Transcript_13901/g.39730  ORF Transcript_13901/g.39730 Transcript_13901/m.39730 type:complete len:105 (-) Transcript_13901:267-581(-)
MGQEVSLTSIPHHQPGVPPFLPPSAAALGTHGHVTPGPLGVAGSLIEAHVGGGTNKDVNPHHVRTLPVEELVRGMLAGGLPAGPEHVVDARKVFLSSGAKHPGI